MTTTTAEKDREEEAGRRMKESRCVGGEDGREGYFGDDNDRVFFVWSRPFSFSLPFPGIVGWA
jgi:hypothetical protein